MQKKQLFLKTKGMNQDLSASAFNPEYSFENLNLRLSTNEDNTLLSWVNEKGTGSITAYNENGEVVDTIWGHPIGTTVLGNYLILFTCIPSGRDVPSHRGRDSIYRFEYASKDKNNIICKQLYTGSLNFSIEHPLETLPSYESEAVQKVYWTDGINPPRVINICQDDDHISKYTKYSFDFVPVLRLQETVKVQKMIGASGTFAPGVIQYAFTYFHQYGQESCVFYTTPLYYISHRDRGASPEDKVDNAFKISIKNPDREFDFLRIYSIQRTSINATPIVKRVADIQLDRTMKEHVYPSNYSISYIDRGLTGNTIDPTELLYKGGESITALTMEQKDATLFFGNISIDRPQIELEDKDIRDNVTLKPWSRSFYSEVILQQDSENQNNYGYCNQLTSYKDEDKTQSVPCGGFKGGNYYRFGLQFQYKTGKWSTPIWLGNDKDDDIAEWYYDDFEDAKDTRSTGYNSEYDNVKSAPSANENTGEIVVPTFIGTLSKETGYQLYQKGYRKMRPVVVFPTMQDKIVLCQGVVNPTMYIPAVRDKEKGVDAQSSWFFRPLKEGIDAEDHYHEGNGTSAPTSQGALPYASRGNYYEHSKEHVPGTSMEDVKTGYIVEESFDYELMRTVEIQGDFTNIDTDDPEYNPNLYKFCIDRDFLTLHSPDILFNDYLSVTSYIGIEVEQVGYAKFTCTYSDIDIQTETPHISSIGSGFIHKALTDNDGPFGIISGLFYDDYIVQSDKEGDNNVFKKLGIERSPCQWMVYTWNKNGSLNNDIDRPANAGTASAKLKKKVISNLRYSTSIFNKSNRPLSPTCTPELFSSEENTIIKLGTAIYKGNVDTLLTPKRFDGMYFVYRQSDMKNASEDISFTQKGNWWKFFSTNSTNADITPETGLGLYKRFTNPPPADFFPDYVTPRVYNFDGVSQTPEHIWARMNDQQNLTGFIDLIVKKEGVRMKYKSTPHVVLKIEGNFGYSNEYWSLPIVELKRSKPANIFGGTTADALRENTWVPCGDPVALPSVGGIGTISFYCDYGDTYYQRWDCLKTYPYTREDTNQVVEIGSFLLESYVNVDGRYDRNRAQLSNINMSPQNFNKLNQVYSQIDNFFSYKIPPKDAYENTKFSNQLTWTLTKQPGADVDLWTQVSLGSTLDLDGDKGRITKLTRCNDQLLAFQEQGFSQILYNENAQISTTQGTPIEIANSGKVQGKRYISDSVGCSNKWSVVNTPMGVYFMDNQEKAIYVFNGQLNNLSYKGGFNTWCKNNIVSVETFFDSTTEWDPLNFKNFVCYYDRQNQDILFINDEIALAYSEKFGTFTSFYNYGGVPYFCNFKEKGIWIHRFGERQRQTKLWRHREGSYCNFFGEDYGYGITFIANPEFQTDKLFTNIEFCSTVDEDIDDLGKSLLPFDYVEAWNEYQHGYTHLSHKDGHDSMRHYTSDKISTLKRKFRLWRCDIPRDNAPLAKDEGKHIFRTRAHPNNRLRNTWIYLNLQKEAGANKRTEIHDVIVTYFG